MIRRTVASLLVTPLLLAATPAGAFYSIYETAPAPEDPWTASPECRISYYNTCRGWIWIWGTIHDGERTGVVFETCCPHAEVLSTWSYSPWGTLEPGWGYTSVSLQAVDANDCPTGIPIAQQVRGATSGWNLSSWEHVAVPSRFAVVETGFWGGDRPVFTMGTDHPGPTGSAPAACGACYPPSRESHSFSWGRESAPLCPGQPFFDGTCNAERLVSVELSCPTSTEPSTWGTIKALYR